MIALAVLDAMVEAGCSGAQVVAAIRADANERARRRYERLVERALFPPPVVAAPAAKMNDPDISGTAAPMVTAPITHIQGRKDIARAALAVAPGLTKSARRVGAVIVDAYNIEHGRGWAHIGAIAGRLGISDKSVQRAFRALDAAGLIRCVVHGGPAHANAFEPQWDRFAAVVRADGWRPRQMNEPDISAPTRTILSAEPVKTVPQNRISKQNLPAPRAKRPDPRQPQMLLPMPGGRQALAASKARQRLIADIGDVAEREPGFNVSPLSDADWSAADQAEARREGDGIGVVRQRLAARRAQAPPAIAARG